jgi:hypothetical protein
MTREKKGPQDRGRPQPILSKEHILPLWTRLGSPDSGPKKIVLVSRKKSIKSINAMSTLEVAGDMREFVLVLARRAKQKRDGGAIVALVKAAKTINWFLESVETLHEDLFAFASEESEWPVNLSPKQQIVDAVVARLECLKVGSKSIPPTKRGAQIDPKNWATQIATELIRRLEAWRDYQLALRSTRRRKTNATPIHPVDVDLLRSGCEELGPMPKMCSKLWKLLPLGPTTWETWWTYASAALDALWKQNPELYQECINRESGADEMKYKEGVRRNYVRRLIKQAFASIAKSRGTMV